MGASHRWYHMTESKKRASTPPTTNIYIHIYTYIFIHRVFGPAIEEGTRWIKEKKKRKFFWEGGEGGPTAALNESPDLSEHLDSRAIPGHRTLAHGVLSRVPLTSRRTQISHPPSWPAKPTLYKHITHQDYQHTVLCVYVCVCVVRHWIYKCIHIHAYVVRCKVDLSASPFLIFLFFSFFLFNN